MAEEKRADLANEHISASQNAEEKAISTKPTEDHSSFRSAVSSSGDRASKSVPTQYELLEELGEGGMGVVYKARNRFTGKIVAIKLIRTGKANDTTRQRFLREAKAASKFVHENAVAVLDFGILDDSPYLVMEFAAGETLQARLERCGTLSEGETVSIFDQACAALAQAHSAGVIHRDLKPSNIVIQSSDGSEIVKILDFGIAKMIDAGAQLTLTQTGEIIGTPLYMSPEQLKCTATDARSDLYSIGAVMYECLSGTPPHSGDSVYEVMFKRMNNDPAAFSESGKAVSPELERIILKCLAREPQQRYSDAGVVRTELERFRQSKELGKRLFGSLALVSDKRTRSNLSPHTVKALKIGAATTAAIAIVALLIIAIPRLVAFVQTKQELSDIQSLIDQGDLKRLASQFGEARDKYIEADVEDRKYKVLADPLRQSLYEHVVECCRYKIPARGTSFDAWKENAANNITELQFLNRLIKRFPHSNDIENYHEVRKHVLGILTDLCGASGEESDHAIRNELHEAIRVTLDDDPNIDETEKIDSVLQNLVQEDISHSNDPDEALRLADKGIRLSNDLLKHESKKKTYDLRLRIAAFYRSEGEIYHTEKPDQKKAFDALEAALNSWQLGQKEGQAPDQSQTAISAHQLLAEIALENKQYDKAQQELDQQLPLLHYMKPETAYQQALITRSAELLQKVRQERASSLHQ